MRRFKNLLVGVDLCRGDLLVSDELTPPTHEAVERALWLAKLNQARLLFFCALDSLAAQMSAERQILLEEDHGQRTVEDHAKEILEGLAQRAAREGVRAENRVVLGKGWVEIIRQVLRGQHDLVVVGTRHLGRVSRILLGSTGIKLLRKCPCPVWVTQPRDGRGIRRILVATDFSPVCDAALDLGAAMAALQGCELHVIHAVDCRLLEAAKQGEPEDRKQIELIEEMRMVDARRHLDQQLARASVLELRSEPDVHLVKDEPSAAIQEHVERLEIDLLVMGTLARSGISGVFVGNTAERLLPQISCSLLAVKPQDFRSPITLDDAS